MKQAKPKKQLGPGFRTPDHFKGFTFNQGRRAMQPRFNPTTFKTQHKG